MTGNRLLYIDHDPVFCGLVVRQMTRRGYHVDVATDTAQGVALIGTNVGAVALSHDMPGREGLETLDAILALADPPPVILVTGATDSRVAVSALKAGAADYVAKDAGEAFADLLEAAVGSAIARVELRRRKEAADRAVRTARDAFEALAAERQMLMREVNHRVGNSLQLVAAFLHLQATQSTTDETRSALDEANRRVLAIAQLHRRFHVSDDVEAVALHAYLKDLVDDLRTSTDGGASSDLLWIEADAVTVDPDRAVTIGIIVTELVIGAIKYAHAGSPGAIRVKLRAGSARDRYTLSVEDDSARTEASATGIGKIIIKAMASKLGTTVAFEIDRPGTRASMVFSVPTTTRP